MHFKTYISDNAIIDMIVFELQLGTVLRLSKLFLLIINLVQGLSCVCRGVFVYHIGISSPGDKGFSNRIWLVLFRTVEKYNI